jgi:Domain of unknown function (DUF4124)
MLRTALTLTLSIAAYALTAQSACADVYEYKDEKGNKLYTDKPRTLPAQRLDIKTQKTDTVAVQARTDADLKRMQEADKARRQGSGAASDQQQASELSAKDKAERCTKARERYDSYMNSQRLYETLPNNERRYLSDAELDAARNSAKVSMETLCS